MTQVINQATNNYPPVGHSYIFDIGVAQVKQTYPKIDTMRYQVLTGPRTGNADTVAIEVVEIAANVFLVSWQEADHITVVHVEDFNTHTFHSCVTMPDGTFRRIHSKMWRATP